MFLSENFYTNKPFLCVEFAYPENFFNSIPKPTALFTL